MALFLAVFQPKEKFRGESRIRGEDLPWLACTILAGGVIAPFLPSTGVSEAPAATAALILNFEAVATTVIARGVFREHVGGRVAGAVVLISAATLLLTLDISGVSRLSLGALAVAG